jgi:hypothetical protein
MFYNLAIEDAAKAVEKVLPAADTESIEQAGARWPRTDDAWDAVVWAIARDSEAGTPLVESGRIRAVTIEGAKSIGMPTVTVVYEIEKHKAMITDALFAEPDAAGRA